LGAEDAQEFCLQHGLSEYETGIVQWLVEQHLLMSMTAQKRDTSDPEVIRDFANQVGSGMRLRGLFLLTVADLRGTNPALWTPWRESLLYRLYRATERQLQRGTDQPIDNEHRLNALKASALKRVTHADTESCIQFWGTLPESDLLHYTDDELAWQTECVLGCAEDEMTRVFVRHQGSHHCTEILVYERQRSRLFVPITATLARLATNVLYARITETRGQEVLNTFLVTDTDGLPIHEGFQLAELRKRLEEAAQNPAASSHSVQLRPGTRERYFEVPTEIEFSQHEAPPETRIHLSTSDHPGLLWTLSCALEDCGAHIRQARITTLGAQAQDVFSVTDADSQPIVDPQTLTHIEDTLRSRITQLQSHDDSDKQAERAIA